MLYGCLIALPEADSGKRLAKAIECSVSDDQTLAVGAIKLIADGSPQARTALLSEPYIEDPSLDSDYRSIAYIDERVLHDKILRYHMTGFQLAIHGNGDGAIGSSIRGLEKAQQALDRPDARHVLVHAQTITQEQLVSLARAHARAHASASFFVSHTHVWGDWYRLRVLGEQRTARISPLASADKAAVRYSIHTDAFAVS